MDNYHFKNSEEIFPFAFLLDQLDRAGLGHNTFTPEALALIVRSGDGLLRRTSKQVNRVLIQPHWRNDCDHPTHQ
ncbi:MAG: hypothetical protein WCS65_02660 [Verrucomicrobiae bacterium]